MIAVYKITNPKKRVYVGSSIDVKERFASYRRLDCEAQIRLFNSLKKYGVKKHTFEIITECSIDNIKKIEAYYGNLYNCLGRNGLNCQLPHLADGFNKMSEETRKKIGLSKRGNKNTLGFKWSEESKQRLRQSLKNIIRKPHSQNTRRKMSISALGDNNHNAKIVLNTQTGIYYECVMDAANSCGINYNTLRSKLYGRNKNNTPFVYV